jgi:Penicillin-insensitive murein endopeptidase
MSANEVFSVSWRPDEEWLDVDVLWFGERVGAPALAGFVLPPLPRFEPTGLAASRQRREAWRRRRKARGTALMLVPAVMVLPALIRSGGAGAGVIAEDPPSLAFGVGTQTGRAAPILPAAPTPTRSQKAAAEARSDAPPTIEWRNATSVGLWWGGSLVAGTQLPVEGPDWVTWNPNTDSTPNAPNRLYGNERTIRTIVSVIEAYRTANPRAPRVVVGDISFEHGGPMDAHVSHQNGLDVDIYYPRLDRGLREARLPEAIDRRLSQDLLDRFVAAGATMVFVGYATGLHGPDKVVIPYPNHENHMHVRLPARR